MPGPLALFFALASPPGAMPSATPCVEIAGPGEIDVPAGTRLRAAPNPSALALAVVDADMPLPVSARCGTWAEVRWGGFRGWVRPGDTEGPSLGGGSRPADAARIDRARVAMKPPIREVRIGPWRLVTDVPARELKGLDAVASRLAEAYSDRTGLATAPGPDQAVVIFASDASYRSFAEADTILLSGTRGHAGGGLAALAMGRTPLETRVLLVHELTHLLSRSALGERIPAWLDEGLAEDLAWCRVDAAGRLQPGTLDVHAEARWSATIVVRERSGPRETVDAWRVRVRAGQIPPLADLLAPDSLLFATPDKRRDAMTASAMLVRWCLADPARAATFRELLTAVSLGGAGDAKAVAAALGFDVPGLERAFRTSLR